MSALAGRAALVTGGSRGIGRAIVERLAGDGAAVLFSYRENRAAADEVLAAARELPGSAQAAQADLGDVARRLRDGGRIVNVSTINTVSPAAGIALYAASKAAIEQFIAIAAIELGERQITVNTVSPGFTDTDLLRRSAGLEALPTLAATSPLGRLGSPADIAHTVAFLVSEEGGWMTGQNLRACGGVV